MKARYLLFFSYIGSGFRSSERLWIKGGNRCPDPSSIQGSMEIALLRLKPLAYPSLTLSSRTDGGVHALNNSAHIDLERYGSKIYDPNCIVYESNRYFHRNNIAISINKCLRVSDTFNARFLAFRRTYLYRLAVIKSDIPDNERSMFATYIPIEEWKRCHFLKVPSFDVEKFKEAAKYFVGYHDFTTFKRFDKLKELKHNRREIYSIEVRPGQNQVTCYSHTQPSYFNYLDIEIKGRAFVHNQIRRMLGTLISVAIGKLPPEEVKVMLQIPSKESWYSFIQSGPPDGLYLCNVEYRPEDLIYTATSDDTVEEVTEQTSVEDIFEDQSKVKLQNEFS